MSITETLLEWEVQKVLNLKLSKAGSRNIVVTYPRTKEIKR